MDVDLLVLLVGALELLLDVLERLIVLAATLLVDQSNKRIKRGSGEGQRRGAMKKVALAIPHRGVKMKGANEGNTPSGKPHSVVGECDCQRHFLDLLFE